MKFPGKIDDGGAASDHGKAATGLRSYQELQRAMALKDVKFNTEFEKVQALADAYGNATAAERLAILDDLEFFLHQVWTIP